VPLVPPAHLSLRLTSSFPTARPQPYGEFGAPQTLIFQTTSSSIKKLADRSGLDAAKYAGHSLRAGHATSAAIAGASERSIMRQRPDTGRFIWFGAIFGTGTFSGKIPLASWDSEKPWTQVPYSPEIKSGNYLIALQHHQEYYLLTFYN
jgi:hypothetical protein